MQGRTRWPLGRLAVMTAALWLGCGGDMGAPDGAGLDGAAGDAATEDSGSMSGGDSGPFGSEDGGGLPGEDGGSPSEDAATADGGFGMSDGGLGAPDGGSDGCLDADGADDDSRCAPEDYCVGGRCRPDLGDGQPCGSDSQCTSGHCANGFCCASGDCCFADTDCPGAGTVSPVCEDFATCQGTRGVVECVESRCVTREGVEDDSACDPSTEASDCGPYPAVACTGEEDQTAPVCADSCGGDEGCDSDAHCSEGSCVPDAMQGEGCSMDGECASGLLCVDGVCCDGACDGTCESCALSGTAGTCAPIPAASDPEDDCEHGALCDGARACECPGGTTETACGDAVDDDCDGLVDCADPDCEAQTCAPEAVETSPCAYPSTCATGGSRERTTTTYACSADRVCAASVAMDSVGCTRSTQSDPCDDGMFCNGTDTCSDGTCSAHAGDPCASTDEPICLEADGACACSAVCGDADQDQSDPPELADAVLTARFAEGLQAPTMCQVETTDVERDGAVTGRDAQLVLGLRVGTISSGCVSCTQVCGDFDQDGAFELADAQQIETQATDSTVITACELDSGDVNGDGQISQRDSQLALQMFVGDPDPFSDGCTYCNQSCGDVDASGDVDVTDGTAAGQIAEGSRDANVCEYDAADVDGDGVVTEDDLQLILVMATRDPDPFTRGCQFCNLSCGDVNGENGVTIADATRTQQIAEGSHEPTACEYEQADVDGDGEVTTDDAHMVTLMLGESAPFSAGCAVCDLACGDLDGSGTVTVSDAARIGQIAEESYSPTACEWDAADIDGDDAVTETDANLALERAVTDPSPFPDGCVPP